MRNKKFIFLLAGGVLLLLFGGAVLTGAYLLWKHSFSNPSGSNNISAKIKKDLTDVKKFKSNEEFFEYMRNGYNDYNVGFARNSSLSGFNDVDLVSDSKESNAQVDTSLSDSDLYSTTNVQVFGIDEPDILKNDNRYAYFYDGGYYNARNFPKKNSSYEDDCSNVKVYDIKRPDGCAHLYNITNIVKLDQPSDMKKIGIMENGHLLLTDKLIILLQNNAIKAYERSNVENSDNRDVKWSIDFDKNILVSARMYDNKLYVVSVTNKYSSCPIDIMKIGKENISVDCTDIYRPDANISSNAVYTVSVIDISSGKLKKDVSFVGNGSDSYWYNYNTTIYMSYEYIFVAYNYDTPATDYFVDFMMENKDLFPQYVLEKVEKLETYDISESSKLNELEIILFKYKNSLSEEEQSKFDDESSDRSQKYLREHKRELSFTGIAKIELSDLDFKDVGVIPGRLLNQFSMDYYDNNLRVASTVGLDFWGGSDTTVSDVYVLNSKMEKIGEVLDLGVGERIYSVRFINGQGYVVTFKQTDPLYVIDLSDAKNPKKVGELKIPGYSSYLHPLSDKIILGVGFEEKGGVKLSLFDVSDPSNPVEKSKYILQDTYTEIMSNHHAFMIDTRNDYFFIPGNTYGYIFNYKNNDLKLQKKLMVDQPIRALYIGDYFYVFSNKKVVSFEIDSWNRVGELSLRDDASNQ